MGLPEGNEDLKTFILKISDRLQKAKSNREVIENVSQLEKILGTLSPNKPEKMDIYEPSSKWKDTKDAYTSTILKFHFKETPYWKKRDINPEDITGVESALANVGNFQTEVLRNKPVEYITPEPLDDNKAYLVNRSSGTTGKPKEVPWLKSTKKHMVDWYELNFRLKEIPEGKHWLCLGSYDGLEEDLKNAISRMKGGASYVAIETGDGNPEHALKGILKKQIQKAVKEGKPPKVGAKKAFEHPYLERAYNNLKHFDKKNKPEILFTTPPLISFTLEDIIEDKKRISHVIWAGTVMKPKLRKKLNRTLLKDKEEFGFLGKYDTGACFEELRDDYNVVYVSKEPEFQTFVVDRENPKEIVNYRKEGNMATGIFTPLRTMFLNVEDDIVTRVKSNLFPQDAIADPHR